MRADNNNPQKVYANFGDWLFRSEHRFWVIALLLGYLYYLGSTFEI